MIGSADGESIFNFDWKIRQLLYGTTAGLTNLGKKKWGIELIYTLLLLTSVLLK